MFGIEQDPQHAVVANYLPRLFNDCALVWRVVNHAKSIDEVEATPTERCGQMFRVAVVEFAI